MRFSHIFIRTWEGWRTISSFNMGCHIKPLLWRMHWGINFPLKQGLCMGTNIEEEDRYVMGAYWLRFRCWIDKNRQPRNKCFNASGTGFLLTSQIVGAYLGTNCGASPRWFIHFWADVWYRYRGGFSTYTILLLLTWDLNDCKITLTQYVHFEALYSIVPIPPYF